MSSHSAISFVFVGKKWKLMLLKAETSAKFKSGTGSSCENSAALTSSGYSGKSGLCSEDTPQMDL